MKCMFWTPTHQSYNVWYSIYFSLHSLMVLLSCITHSLLPSHCLNSSVYFLLYLLNFALHQCSRARGGARAYPLEPFLWQRARFVFVANQRGSRERSWPPVEHCRVKNGKLRLLARRVLAAWVSRRPLGARGRALGKNLKPRELLMLLSWLVTDARATETVTSIKVMVHNRSLIITVTSPIRIKCQRLL